MVDDRGRRRWLIHDRGRRRWIVNDGRRRRLIDHSRRRCNDDRRGCRFINDRWRTLTLIRVMFAPFAAFMLAPLMFAPLMFAVFSPFPASIPVAVSPTAGNVAVGAIP